MKKTATAVLLSLSLVGSALPAAAQDTPRPSETIRTEYKAFDNFEELRAYVRASMQHLTELDIRIKTIPKPDWRKSTKPKPPQQKPTSDSKQQKPHQVEKQSKAEQQMLQHINQARQEHGLKSLEVDPQLTKIARLKAKDMINQGYFSHQSPTYGSPFEMLNQFDVSYRTAGENLAGNASVDQAHSSLMNSDGHRANILNPDYSKIGIGIVEGGPYGTLFVQLFKG